ncbi:MAG: hypothetical protein M9952_13175 [Microthrixaceae bacterium]|nr:hypothetical protein [Microthrixaceae bacterium]MCO5313876.1 hypothetical protein [Microthrixaceae bacterium]HPB44871.1 hypothetical protein [Microthrixaceae bacterium]
MATTGHSEIIMSPECRACYDLGIEPLTDFRSDAGWRTVVSAHRAIVKRYHPDRFVERSAEEMAMAVDRTTEANCAYTLLQTARRTEAPQSWY